MARAAVLALLALLAADPALAQTLKRTPDESVAAFAARALNRTFDEGSDHVLETTWNGRPYIFIDYLKTYDRTFTAHLRQSDGTVREAVEHETEEERPVVALEGQPDGAYRKIEITLGEEEGGGPQVEAIGFANADSDPAKELIVILKWAVVHYDVGGNLYEVRIFDDAKAGQTKLTELKAVERHFAGHNCDCDRRDGKSERFRFKTIASVKAELKRLGY